MNFIVQTRERNNLRGFEKGVGVWVNGPVFSTLKLANESVIKTIENGITKAENIRVVEVVSTFSAEIKVSSQTIKREDKEKIEPPLRDWFDVNDF